MGLRISSIWKMGWGIVEVGVLEAVDHVQFFFGCGGVEPLPETGP
jgi:hypothetical protein